MELIRGNIRQTYPVDLIGGKAHGLMRLKKMQGSLTKIFTAEYADFLRKYTANRVKIPNFFVVPVNYDIKNKNNLEAILTSADKIKSKKFAVRSSSPFEDGKEYPFDGIFHTELNVSKQGLIEAVEIVRQSAKGRKAKAYAKEFNINIDDRMAVIIQQMGPDEEHLIDKGVIYSKFPCSKNITKIIRYDFNMIENGAPTFEVGVIEREEFEWGLHPGDALIEGFGMKRYEADGLAQVAYAIEKKFGYPVRIEYQIGNDNEYRKRIFYVLQARSVAGMKNIQDIKIPEIDKIDHKGFLFGTIDVNTQGDKTLPAVVVMELDNEKWEDHFHIPNDEIRKLDKKYKDGYVLVCQYLQFWYHDDLDSITPNKKAVVATSNLGRHHDFDIAREKNLLYVGSDELYSKLLNKEVTINSGDMLRVMSDGIKGYVYKVDDKK